MTIPAVGSVVGSDLTLVILVLLTEGTFFDVLSL